MNDLTTEGSFYLQAKWAIEVLGLILWHIIHGCLYNKTFVADVRSIVARIKWLYCRSVAAFYTTQTLGYLGQAYT